MPEKHEGASLHEGQPLHEPGRCCSSASHRAIQQLTSAQVSDILLSLQDVALSRAALAGFPSVVPWAGEDAPRFVADVMCEGLARQLRMVGVDTVCALPPPKHNRHHVHRCRVPACLLSAAELETECPLARAHDSSVA